MFYYTISTQYSVWVRDNTPLVHHNSTMLQLLYYYIIVMDQQWITKIKKSLYVNTYLNFRMFLENFWIFRRRCSWCWFTVNKDRFHDTKLHKKIFQRLLKKIFWNWKSKKNIQQGCHKFCKTNFPDFSSTSMTV